MNQHVNNQRAHNSQMNQHVNNQRAHNSQMNQHVNNQHARRAKGKSHLLILEIHILLLMRNFCEVSKNILAYISHRKVVLFSSPELKNQVSFSGVCLPVRL
jgi:hypothetical protein